MSHDLKGQRPWALMEETNLEGQIDPSLQRRRIDDYYIEVPRNVLCLS